MSLSGRKLRPAKLPNRDYYLGTVINGKYVVLHLPNKRHHPGYCELCGNDNTRLGYHHWDDSCPSKGLWLCHKCHMLAEATDGGISSDKYLRLKMGVEEEFKQKGLESARPSLLDVVMSWGLRKEV